MNGGVSAARAESSNVLFEGCSIPWWYEEYASPATMAEVDAKIFGFAASEGLVPEGLEQVQAISTENVGVDALVERRTRAQSDNDYFVVDRTLPLNRPVIRRTFAPFDSVEGRSRTSRRLAFYSGTASISLVLLAEQMIAQGGFDWTGRLAALVLIAFALYFILYASSEALVGWGSGRTRGDRRFAHRVLRRCGGRHA